MDTHKFKKSPLSLSSSLSISICSLVLFTTSVASYNVPPIYIPYATGSQGWYGPDGKWSAITIRVGNPPTQLNLIPTTNTNEIWAVNPTGCGSEIWNQNLNQTSTSCEALRGNTFDTSKSSTWSDQSYAEVFSDKRWKDMGYSLNGKYGLDDVRFTVGGEDLILEDQLVATFENTTVFLPGVLGLFVANTTFDQTKQFKALLTRLYEEKKVPSQSWGFTAGAYYREKNVPCNVVLGGYDLNRFVYHDRKFAMPPELYPQAGLHSISANSSNGGESKTVLSDPILVYIDSTTPYYWFPKSTCDEIANLFSLVYDDDADLYFYSSDDAYKSAKEKDYTFYFTLMNGTDGSGESVVLNLPFMSFDLEHEFLNDSSKEPRPYFPMKRAPTSDTYTLGRAFLQETYLVVDYSRAMFSVHQAYFNGNTGMQQNTVTITDEATDDTDAVATGGSPAATSLAPEESGSIPQKDGSSNDSGSNNGSGGSKSNKGAVIGGAVGGAIVALLLLAGLFFFCRRRKQKKQAIAINNEPSYFPSGADVHDGFTSPTQETKPIELDPTEARHELPGTIPAEELEAEVNGIGQGKDEKIELDATGVNLDRQLSDDSGKSLGSSDEKLAVPGLYDSRSGTNTVSSLSGTAADPAELEGSEVGSDAGGNRSINEDISPSRYSHDVSSNSSDAGRTSSDNGYMVSPITPTWQHAFSSHAQNPELGDIPEDRAR